MNFCACCRFWEFLYEPEHDDAFGECRRHAPQPIQHVLKEISRLSGLAAWATEEQANIEHDDDDYISESAESYRVYEWPRTHAWDWCGEFARAERTVLGKSRALQTERIEAYMKWKLPQSV
jgi:hypothetical protein